MLDTIQEGALPRVTHCTGLAEGAMVMTLTGPVPVERLVPGDRILTRSGALRLHSVQIRTEERARMVHVSAAALGTDRPEADITLAADQSILVRDWRAQAMTGKDTAMIPAARLADGEYIRAVAARDVRIYALHFTIPAVIYAQGLELTCDPVMVDA
jgi:hypothetical protein